MLIPPKRLLLVLVMISSTSATVCTLFEPIAAKWRLFRGGNPLWRPRSLHPVALNFVAIN